MNELTELIKVLDKDRVNLLLSIEHAKEARDKAPSAMESHSDTTRSQNEKLVFALEMQLKELDNNIKKIPQKLPENSKVIQLWSVAKLKNNLSELVVMIVPEGLGGKKIAKITTITETTPLGMAIINKPFGKKYTFQNIQWTIEKYIR